MRHVQDKEDFDPEALEYAIGMVFGDFSLDLIPTTNGLRLFEAGERPDLASDEAEGAWHFTVIAHATAAVLSYYRGRRDYNRRKAEPSKVTA